MGVCVYISVPIPSSCAAAPVLQLSCGSVGAAGGFSVRVEVGVGSESEAETRTMGEADPCAPNAAPPPQCPLCKPA